MCSIALMSVVMSAALAQGVPTQAIANPVPPALQGVAKMIRAGDLAKALDTIDQHLKTDAENVQGLFLRGVVLAEMKRIPAAIDAFTSLIARHPQLPEPYNNLAVLHAANGQLNKAREALEQAIANNPQNALVHENLGDVYARMAAELYQRAITLDPTDRNARAKLAFIRDLSQGKVSALPAKPAANPSPSPTSTSHGDQK
jgi:tetratricopeptide (TPR) repeat protein